MPRSSFRVFEDLTASPRYIPFLDYYVPRPPPSEPVLGIPHHIPRRAPVLPAHLDTPGPASASASTTTARERSEANVSAALRDAAPTWPPWMGRDCVEKGMRDAEYRLTELRKGAGKGVEQEFFGDGEEVVLEMEEDERKAKGEKRGRGKRIWGWVKKRLGIGRK